VSNLAFSSADFRAALGRFATGVTVVTTRSPEGDWVGLTVNSFNSVSLSPPLVLWSLGTKAGSLQSFMQASHYAIHVLSVQQQALALRFASKLEKRFDGLSFTEGAGGAPLLDGCAAVFECRNKSRYPEGDHVIFVGEVLQCRSDAAKSPLLFHGGQFYTEHPL
jgi:flavin reductase (DIM6/NTAB) family NADH-FMN oxidoreductase RutF